MLAIAIAALGLLAIASRGAVHAGSGTFLSISNPAGFELQAPADWQAQTLAANTAGQPSTLREAIVSTDGSETIRVYVANETIAPEDIELFVASYLSNAAIGSTIMGQSQTVTVSGAANAATLSAQYTNAGGMMLAESVLAAATGTQLYVLEVVTPNSFATQNADLIQTILTSFSIDGGPAPAATVTGG